MHIAEVCHVKLPLTSSDRVKICTIVTPNYRPEAELAGLIFDFFIRICSVLNSRRMVLVKKLHVFF